MVKRKLPPKWLWPKDYTQCFHVESKNVSRIKLLNRKTGRYKPPSKGLVLACWHTRAVENQNQFHCSTLVLEVQPSTHSTSVWLYYCPMDVLMKFHRCPCSKEMLMSWYTLEHSRKNLRKKRRELKVIQCQPFSDPPFPCKKQKYKKVGMSWSNHVIGNCSWSCDFQLIW